MGRKDILETAEKMLKEHLKRIAMRMPRAYPKLTGETPGSIPHYGWTEITRLSCVSRECWFWAEYTLELWEKANVIEEKWDENWNKTQIWHMRGGWDPFNKREKEITIEFVDSDRTCG